MSTEDKKRIGPSDGWMIALTAIIAVATGLNVYIFYKESEATGTQIDKLTTKAGGIVDVMNTTLSDSRGAISKAFKANKEAVDASREQSEKALNASINALQLDERPWIYISGLNLKPLILGEPFVAELWFKNEGKTPATPSEGPVFIMVSGFPVRHLEDIPGEHQNRVGMIFPGIVYGPDPVTSAMGGASRLVEGKDIAAFNAKPPLLWIYIYGRFGYKDVFGRHHTTSYCGVSNGGNNFGGCPEGTYPNYAN